MSGLQWFPCQQTLHKYGMPRDPERCIKSSLVFCLADAFQVAALVGRRGAVEKN
jgi:hypothetical protein